MSKTKLHVNYDFDFCMIGIACLEKDYKICWMLNNLFSVKLAKVEDYVSSAGSHSLYKWVDEEMLREYYLISNKSNSLELLVTEHQHTDYFFLIKGELTDEEKRYFSEQIKKLSTVSASYQIDPNALKYKENLMI